MGESNGKNSGKIIPINGGRYSQVSQEARKLKGNNTEKNKTPKQRKNLRKKRRRNVIIGLAAYGIASFLAGIKVNKLLNPGVERKGDKVVIDLDKTGEDITFTGNAHQQFVQSLVDQTIDKEIDADIIEEIESKVTLEDRLNYIKDIYVNEYNQINEKAITTDDVELTKYTDEDLYEDQNGNIIIIDKSYAEENNINTLRDSTYIKARIETEDGVKVEYAKKYKDKFVPVYHGEVPETNSENLLCSEGIGEIIQTGLNWAISNEHEKENDPEVNNRYESQFIKSIRDYRKAQMENAMKGDNIQTTDIQQGMELE